MPMVSYKCSCGYIKRKFYSKAKDIQNKVKCEKCEREVERTLSSPSQRSTIVIDNGVQAKAVEVDRDIVDIIEDRENADFKKRGDSVLDNLK